VHHVAHDQLAERNLAHARLRTLDAAGDLDHVEQFLDGGVAVALLEEPKKPRDEDHGHDDDDGGRVLVARSREDDVCHEGNDGEHDEDARERVGKRPHETLWHGSPLGMVDHVGAVALSRNLYLLSVETSSIACECFVCLVSRAGGQRVHARACLVLCLSAGRHLLSLVSHRLHHPLGRMAPSEGECIQFDGH